MTRMQFESVLDDIYCKLVEYEAKFSRDDFEIAVLVSRTAEFLFEKFGGCQRYIGADPFQCSAYLFGHKIVFVDVDFLISHDGNYELICPVIGCKHENCFPMNASTGDYIYYNGYLKQIRGVYNTAGVRSIDLISVEADFYSDFSDFDFESRRSSGDRLVKAIRDINKRNRQKDGWLDSVDNSEINDYLATLSII